MNINGISKFSGSLADALKRAILGLGGPSSEQHKNPAILYGGAGFYYGDAAGPGHGHVIYNLEGGLAEVLGHDCVPAHEVCRTRNVDFLARQLARVLYADACERVDDARRLVRDLIEAATSGEWTYIDDSVKTPETALQSLNDAGWNVIHFAASHGMVHRLPHQMVTVETLSLRATDGRTPVDLAHDFGEVLPEHVSELLDNGAGTPTPAFEVGY